MKALLVALVIAVVIALYVLLNILIGWLVVVVISWFGPQLAIWQGVVIAFLVSGLTGGSARAAKR